MKRSLLLSLVVLITLAVNAQVKVESSGTVKVLNSLQIVPGTGGYFIVDPSGYYGAPVLYTNYNNCGEIGKSDHSLYKGYFRYLWVNGAAITSSDERIKKNKKRLEGSLSKIKQIKGYKYDLAIDDSIADYDQMGFLAQELMEVLPEAVVYDTVADKYGVNYTMIIPLLVEAMNEQQALIESLLKDKDKNKNGSITKLIDNIETQNKLFQNAPNPFTKTTKINFAIKENANSSMLNIYDMSGVQIRSISINNTGDGYIEIGSNELKPGMYLYALIVDGQVIDTKQMILTN